MRTIERELSDANSFPREHLGGIHFGYSDANFDNLLVNQKADSPVHKDVPPLGDGHRYHRESSQQILDLMLANELVVFEYNMIYIQVCRRATANK